MGCLAVLAMDFQHPKEIPNQYLGGRRDLDGAEV